MWRIRALKIGPGNSVQKQISHFKKWMALFKISHLDNWKAQQGMRKGKGEKRGERKNEEREIEG